VRHLELFERAAAHGDRVAIVDSGGAFTYRDLLRRSADVARALSGGAGSALAEVAEVEPAAPPPVAYLIAPGFGHVATQWGIWGAGAIGVPLSTAQAPAEWAYAVADSEAGIVVVEPALADAMRAAIANAARVVTTTELLDRARSNSDRGSSDPRTPTRDLRISDLRTSERYSSSHAALILYTSGTTGKPKGVVLTHANIEAQVRCLVASWEWRADDRILHVLPLHHVHGIVNVLTCALWAGATCEMLPRFDAEVVWDVFATGRLTLFMAVPTIYARLIAAWEGAPADGQRALSNGCRAMRLMVSGSAALPVRVLERWREISGHVLLERYGMTEIGMTLSNPLHGERRPGFVGVPLPGVHVQIVDEHGRDVAPGTAGELEVRGPGVFHQYWRRPDATASAFRDGWFRTGDVAVLESGMYRLLGRQSVDIIKSGGYKISALEIEETLREHPGVAECAVVGVEDPEWGERIAVAIVARGEALIELEALRDWARPHLARYTLPTQLLIVDRLPRNAMGKVFKPAVRKLFTAVPAPGLKPGSPTG
jgi:malonyl-CoA/methylmalonyl-CoA synthetase